MSGMKNKNIEKNYLTGHFGGVPIIYDEPEELLKFEVE